MRKCDRRPAALQYLGESTLMFLLGPWLLLRRCEGCRFGSWIHQALALICQARIEDCVLDSLSFPEIFAV